MKVTCCRPGPATAICRRSTRSVLDMWLKTAWPTASSPLILSVLLASSCGPSLARDGTGLLAAESTARISVDRSPAVAAQQSDLSEADAVAAYRTSMSAS